MKVQTGSRGMVPLILKLGSSCCGQFKAPVTLVPGNNAGTYWIGTFWRSWLGHWSWKVAGSIPDGVTKIFHWRNPSGRTAVDSASNRNEYQAYFVACKGGRCVRLTTLPPSCVDCLEIWKPQPPGTLRACPDLYRVYGGCYTFTFYLLNMSLGGSQSWFERFEEVKILLPLTGYEPRTIHPIARYPCKRR